MFGLLVGCKQITSGISQLTVGIFLSAQVDKLLKCTARALNEENRQTVIEKLSTCDGDDNCALTEMIKGYLLDHIYTKSISEEISDQETAGSHLNEQLTEILKDETLDKEVFSCLSFLVAK